MAPKRSQNGPGAISQMYTSLASPDNRSVVTAVAFFAHYRSHKRRMQGLLEWLNQAASRWMRKWCTMKKSRRLIKIHTGRRRILAQQLERDAPSSVSAILFL
ncbi:hypothetical protein E4T47_04732 [Aureobasidium subglaciale]|nr:hypothetical protein E4T47_04732 [Aureobasidium subglaciale]